MIEDNSITVVVPALNEETRLEKAVETIKESIGEWDQYEIIIINDGSSDQTGEIACKLSSKDKNIRVIHHKKNMGRGYSINEGFNAAQMNYIICIQGKQDISAYEVRKIFAMKGKADIVTSYQNNLNERPFLRQIVSKAYTAILNIFFSKSIKYYNGSMLVKKEQYKKIDIKTNSYAFDAEMLLKMIQNGSSFVEVPVNDVFEKGRKSRAFTLKNLYGVITFFLRMNYEINLRPAFKKIFLSLLATIIILSHQAWGKTKCELDDDMRLEKVRALTFKKKSLITGYIKYLYLHDGRLVAILSDRKRIDFIRDNMNRVIEIFFSLDGKIRKKWHLDYGPRNMLKKITANKIGSIYFTYNDDYMTSYKVDSKSSKKEIQKEVKELIQLLTLCHQIKREKDILINLEMIAKLIDVKGDK